MKKLIAVIGITPLLAWGALSVSSHTATADHYCVYAGPVYVQNQQMTDQYQVCFPTP
jgi:hypothetical protein